MNHNIHSSTLGEGGETQHSYITYTDKDNLNLEQEMTPEDFQHNSKSKGGIW